MAQTAEQRRASAKRSRLLALYRITPREEHLVEEFQRQSEHYNILLTKGNPLEKANLYNDHDHTNGLYRGRLSYLINKALGILEGTYKTRTSAVLRALAEYLEHPPAVYVIGNVYGLIGRAKRKKKMVYGPIQPAKKGKS